MQHAIISNGTETLVPFSQEEIDQAALEVAEKNELVIRAAKKAEIRAEALQRIQTHLPAVEGVDDLLLLKKLAQAFQLSAAGVSAKDIYLYTLAKLDQADTAAIDLVIAYDPATDPGWPT